MQAKVNGKWLDFKPLETNVNMNIINDVNSKQSLTSSLSIDELLKKDSVYGEYVGGVSSNGFWNISDTISRENLRKKPT